MARKIVTCMYCAKRGAADVSMEWTFSSAGGGREGWGCKDATACIDRTYQARKRERASA